MFDLDVASLLTPNMILNKVGTGFFFILKKKKYEGTGRVYKSKLPCKQIWIEYEFFQYYLRSPI